MKGSLSASVGPAVSQPPGRLRRLVSHLRHSVWAPVLAKTGGAAALMLGLASVGATSILHPTRALGVPVAQGAGPAPAAPAGSADAGAARSPGLTADGKVILNLANAEQLQLLPGVGPKRAEAILKLRARVGRFRHVRDLLRVRGIGPKRLQRMQGQVVLDAPSEKR